MNKKKNFVLNLDLTFGSVDTDVLEKGIQLNSLAYFNWRDGCNQIGYIININIRFCTPFRRENTLDGFHWFFVTDISGNLLSRYSVIPSNISLNQSFEIPHRQFLISGSQYLSVGTFSNNSNSNLTICLRQTGYVYFSEIVYNISNNKINPQWTGEEFGIALSYVFIAYGKNLIYIISLFFFIK